MAAIVVVFPEPVGPVTNTKPRGRFVVSRTMSGNPSCSNCGILEDNARMRGDVYSQNFFTEEHDGKTVSYTIVDSTQLIDYQKITKKNSNDPFSSDNHNVFLKLQKDLFFQEITVMTAKPLPVKEQLHFLLYLNTKTDPFLAVQTPPPNGILS